MDSGMSTCDLSGLSILLVEDEAMLRRRLAAQLEKLGGEVAAAEDLRAARKLLAAGGFDFALLDVNLPDGLGTDLLREKAFSPDTGVVVLTAHGGVGGAVEAMRLGALDYLLKPFDADQLALVIERTRNARQSARAQKHRQADKAADDFFFSPALAPLENQLRRILAADERTGGALAPILIQGETGTGKTAIARWLHSRGPRCSKELVEVNCSALPESLAESELFGHEAGAFTDARRARMGLFEAASGGTLFLDELPSLSLPIQAKILTAIEDRKIRRVGATKPLAVDVCLIAATSRDLKQSVAQGVFREDLFQRLDLFRVVLPPLRERGEDILKLGEVLARRLFEKHRLEARTISSEAKERLMNYAWPGNVRELAHELERAIVFEDKAQLEFLHLGTGPPDQPSGDRPGWLNPSFRLPQQGFSLNAAIDSLVDLAMTQAQGNISAAARLLGMPRDFVRYRLKQRGVGNESNARSS
jgi:DNA-binding NtrC family response regulator